MNFDPAAFFREFGLSVVIVVFFGWLIYSLMQSFVPKLADALTKRIEAGTKLVEVTTSTVEKLPSVIAQNGQETRDAITASGKETREAIASYEKAVIASETRILDTFQTTLTAIKDEIFDAKQDKIERSIGRLSRSGIASDSEPPAKP